MYITGTQLSPSTSNQRLESERKLELTRRSVSQMTDLCLAFPVKNVNSPITLPVVRKSTTFTVPSLSFLWS